MVPARNRFLPQFPVNDHRAPNHVRAASPLFDLGVARQPARFVFLSTHSNSGKKSFFGASIWRSFPSSRPRPQTRQRSPPPLLPPPCPLSWPLARLPAKPDNS